MKNAFRILCLAVILVAIALTLVACGDNTPDNNCTHTFGEWQETKAPTQNSFGEETRTCTKCGQSETRKTDKLEPTLPPVVLDGASFDDKTVTYNGENQVNENFRGAPRRSEVNFEYYDQNGNLLSTNTGVKDPGVYTVRAVVSLDGYTPSYIEATLTIVEPYTITYKSDISGIVFPDTNPTTYSYADPVIGLADAKYDGYKFKGWFIGDIQVTSVDPKLDVFSGDVEIVAVFQPYLAYPTPYKAGPSNDTRPETLPAIPDYDTIPEDAYVLYDMGNIIHGSENGDNVNFYFETRLSVTEYQPIFSSTTTAGGQPVWEWVDFNDSVDVETATEYGAQNPYIFKENDQKFCSSIRFVPNKTDYSKYDTVEFWVYSENATGATMGFTFWTDHKDTSTCRMTIKLDFSGWKKFSFSYNDFESWGGNMYNMHELRLLSNDSVYSGANKGSLTLSISSDNYIYFSNIYLTNRNNNYNGRQVTADAELMKVMEAYSAIKTAFRDDIIPEAKAFVDAKLDTFDPYAATIWGNNPATPQGINNIYSDLYTLAMCWNAPELGDGYYQNDDVLSLIGEVLNLMWDEDYFGKTIAEGALFGEYTYEEYQPACKYITETMMIIGDHIEHTHAQAWLRPVLNLCPNGVGTGSDELETATISAMAHILSGNKMNALTAIRHMFHCYASGSTPQATSSSMLLIAALAHTEFAPNKACLDTVFNWYMNVVDASVWGAASHIVEAPETSMVYVALIRDLFTAEQQAILDASIMGYVKACDVDIVAYVDTYCLYQAQHDYAAEMQDYVPTGTGYETLYYNKDLGYVVYKTDELYFLLPIGQSPVSNGFANGFGDLVATALDAVKVGNKLAVSAGEYSLLVGEGEVILEHGTLCEVGNDESVYVALGSSDKENDTDYFSASAPCIVYSQVDAGVEVFNVHYSVEAGTLTIYILEGANYELPYEEYENISVSYSGGIMTIEITFPYGADDVSFTLPLKG